MLERVMRARRPICRKPSVKAGKVSAFSQLTGSPNVMATGTSQDHRSEDQDERQPEIGSETPATRRHRSDPPSLARDRSNDNGGHAEGHRQHQGRAVMTMPAGNVR